MAKANQKYLDTTTYLSAEFTSGENVVPIILVDPDTGEPYVPGGGGTGDGFSGEVNTFADLPAPAIDYDLQYWKVITTTKTGSIFNRVVYDAGTYRSIGGVWEYRGPDIPFYFVDNTLYFEDDVSGNKLAYTLDNFTADRTATWQDKDGIVAYLDDITNLYNSDGTLTANRQVDGNNFDLTLGSTSSYIPNFAVRSDTSINLLMRSGTINNQLIIDTTKASLNAADSSRSARIEVKENGSFDLNSVASLGTVRVRGLTSGNLELSSPNYGLTISEANGPVLDADYSATASARSIMDKTYIDTEVANSPNLYNTEADIQGERLIGGNQHRLSFGTTSNRLDAFEVRSDENITLQCVSDFDANRVSFLQFQPDNNFTFSHKTGSVGTSLTGNRTGTEGLWRVNNSSSELYARKINNVIEYLGKDVVGANEYGLRIDIDNSTTRLFSPSFGITVDETDGPVLDADYSATATSLSIMPKSYIDGLALDNRIIVNQSNFSTTLGGTIDSTKEYFLDGIIDTGSTSITIPSTGINISGYNFDLSGLTSSQDNYTMFVSDVGGSGNVLGKDYKIEVTGVNSQVYDLTDATGFNAFEFARINFISCTSLGEINGYRQGLENGTGRFGGSPSLTLSGTWLGGYRVVTSIVRNMSSTTAQPLFKAGTAFSMSSRFATDANVDLGTLQPLLDFAPSNFVNPSTVQLQEMILTRGGVSDPTDTNITPNISASDLVCNWKRNIGLNNTYVGGTITLTAESLTSITQNVWTALAGTFLGTGLQHFSSNTSGELTHDGTSPREFEFTGSLVVEGSPNRSLSVRFNKWDDSASTFTPLDYTIQTRTISNLVGGRDVALFTFDVGGELDQGDYLFVEVRNNTDSSDVTLESSSFFRVQER